MASKDLSYKIAVDSSQGVSGVKQFSSAVKKELKSIEGDFDDTATAGQKVATVLSRMAGELDTELDRAAQAAEALRVALGEDLAGRADVGAIVGDLQRMGLTFEEIVVDADKLAVSLKELDQVQLKGLDSGLGGVKTKFGDVDQSVRGSGSVMANMIGNATQDFGALAGVAGSAGVAIGQMGEYMADASISGEKFSTIVGNFSKIAAPIAGIAIAMQAASDVMGSMKAEDAFNADQVKKFSDAIREGTTFAQELHDTIQETGELEFRQQFDVGLGDVLTPWKIFTSTTKDLIPLMAQLGVETEDFLRFVDDPAAFQAFQQRMIDQGLVTKDNLVAFTALETGVDQYRETEEKAAAAAEILNEVLKITPQIASDATRAFLRATDPIKAFPDEFIRIGKAISTGFRPTVADLETVSEGLGIGLPEALALGKQAWDDQQGAVEDWEQATKAAVAESIQFVEDFADAIEDAALKTADAQLAMRDLAGDFEQIGKREDALQRVFEFGNAPREAEGRIRDIELAIDDLSTAAEGIDLSEGLDPSNVKADALLDAIDSLRPQIQERVVSAFSVGGPEAATKVAQDYVAQVAKELDISKVDAAELIGLTDLEALISVAIEQKSLENAQAQLDILTGLGGETPLTASIALGLQAGTITPRQAKILIQEQLGAAGVEIPAELLVTPRPGALRRARQALQTETDENPIKQPVEVKGLPAAAESIVAGPQPDGWPVIEVPVKPVFSDFVYPPGLMPTGTAGPAGLSAGPMAVGATATAGPSMGPLMLPVSIAAPSRQAPIVNLHTHIHAAVIGDELAVARAVEDATRKTLRLMPTLQ